MQCVREPAAAAAGRCYCAAAPPLLPPLPPTACRRRAVAAACGRSQARAGARMAARARPSIGAPLLRFAPAHPLPAAAVGACDDGPEAAQADHLRRVIVGGEVWGRGGRVPRVRRGGAGRRAWAPRDARARSKRSHARAAIARRAAVAPARPAGWGADASCCIHMADRRSRCGPRGGGCRSKHQHLGAPCGQPRVPSGDGEVGTVTMVLVGAAARRSTGRGARERVAQAAERGAAKPRMAASLVL